MMLPRWFRSRSLNQKLVVLFTGTSALALFAACFSLWVFEWRTYRQIMRREIVTLSESLADSSAAALAFRDDRAAHETLAILRSERGCSLPACIAETGKSPRFTGRRQNSDAHRRRVRKGRCLGRGS